jgi:hypothetical protein
MMTDLSTGSRNVRPVDRGHRSAAPAQRTGWWLPTVALVAWLCWRQADEWTAAGIAMIGAALFIAFFGLSVIRAAALRWWGGALRVGSPPR